MSDIVVVMDEGTSSRPGCKEVSFQGLGPKSKGTQSMDMEIQSLLVIDKGKNHWIAIVVMLLLIKVGIRLRAMNIQSQLHVIISQLQCQSYRYAKMRQLRDGLIDNQRQPHLFFQALHPTYARSNVVHVKQGDELRVDPTYNN